MNKLYKKLKNKKGSFALISAIFIFIVVLAITMYTDVIIKKWTINEVQSVMDASGTNTLKMSVDTEALKREESIQFKGDGSTKLKPNDLQAQARYKNKIIELYKNELAKQIGENGTITKLDVYRVDVDFIVPDPNKTVQDDKFGLGRGEKTRPQIILDSTVTMRVKNSSYFDVTNGIDKQVYSSKENETFSVTYKGTKENGEAELAIRSVSRLVYR